MREEASQREEARSREKGYQEASHLHPEMVHLMPHSERNNLDVPTFMRLQQFEEETSRREREEARQKARDENRQRELALAKKIFKNRYFNGIIIFDTNIFLEEDKETVKSFFRTCISFIEPCNHLDGVSKVGRIVLIKECYEEICNIKRNKKAIRTAPQAFRCIELLQKRNLLIIPDIEIRPPKNFYADPSIIQYIAHEVEVGGNNVKFYSQDRELRVRLRAKLHYSQELFDCFTIEETIAEANVFQQTLSPQDEEDLNNAIFGKATKEYCDY